MTKRYSPLDVSRPSTRLLELLPGPFDSEIECKLHNASLDEHPQYEAVSYCWGEPPKDKVIRLADRLVSLGDNLFSALRHLRRPDKPRILWADALCIDQDDVEEKTQQVQIMGQIYTGCTQCLIWLGDISESIDEGTGFSLNDAKVVFDLLRLFACEEPSDELPATLCHPLQRAQAARTIAGMMSWGNEWWRRIWTVQVSGS